MPLSRPASHPNVGMRNYSRYSMYMYVVLHAVTVIHMGMAKSTRSCSFRVLRRRSDIRLTTGSIIARDQGELLSGVTNIGNQSYLGLNQLLSPGVADVGS